MNHKSEKNLTEKKRIRPFRFPDVIDLSHDFAYKTLSIKIHRSSKTVEANFKKDHEYLSIDAINELLDLTGWLSEHLEVNSFILSNEGEYFCRGFNRGNLAQCQIEEIKKLNQSTHKLIRALYHLPQNLIANIKGRVANEGMELLLPFDLRIAQNPLTINLNYLEDGHCPGPHLTLLLPKLVGDAHARKWLFSGVIEVDDLLASGFIADVNFTIEKYLKIVMLQSPLARIQMKRAMLETFLPIFEKLFPIQESFSNAALINYDYKEATRAKKETRKPQFGNVRELKNCLSSSH